MAKSKKSTVEELEESFINARGIFLADKTTANQGKMLKAREAYVKACDAAAKKSKKTTK